MINRHYAYNATIYYPDKTRFACGVMTHKSWIPNPDKVYSEMYKTIQANSKYECEQEQIRIEYFARV